MPPDDTQPPAKFGWCMDGNHDACRVQVGGTNRILRCGCPCHKESA